MSCSFSIIQEPLQFRNEELSVGIQSDCSVYPGLRVWGSRFRVWGLGF